MYSFIKKLITNYRRLINKTLKNNNYRMTSVKTLMPFLAKPSKVNYTSNIST